MIRFTKKTVILGSVILCFLSSAITFLTLFLTGLVDISSPIDITIQLSDDNEIQYVKEYDGLPYEPSNYVLTSGRLQSGDYLKYITIEEDDYEEYASVGTYECRKLFRIYNSDDEDVTKKYNLKVNPLTVEIVKREIEIEYSFSDMQYGEDIDDYAKFTITSGSIPNGQTLKPNISFRDFKDTPAIPNIYLSKDLELGASIFDKKENDISSNYQIKCISSGINVVKREIHIEPTVYEYKLTSNNIEIGNNYQLTNGSLLEGHQLSCEFSELFKLAGKHSTYLSITIKDQNNQDVTDYYSYNNKDEFIIKVLGNNIDITLSPSNILQKEFDGTSFENELENIINERYKEIDSKGESIQITFSERIKNYIYYDPVNIYLDITDDDITIVHTTYSFTIYPCRLEIKKKSLKIYAPQIDIEYDCNLRFNEEYNLYNEYNKITEVDTKYSYVGLLDILGHSVSYGDSEGKLKNEYFWFERYGDSFINVGFYDYNIIDNYIYVYFTDKDGVKFDVTSSYDIQMLGKINVKAKEINLVDNKEKVYTGEVVDLKNEIWEKNYETYTLNITNVFFINNEGVDEIKDCKTYKVKPINATIICETEIDNKTVIFDASDNYIFDENSLINLTIKEFEINIWFVEKEFVVNTEKTKNALLRQLIDTNIPLACGTHKIQFDSTSIDLSNKTEGSYCAFDLFTLSDEQIIFSIKDAYDNDVSKNYKFNYVNKEEKIIKFSNIVISLNLPTITQPKSCDYETILSNLCAEITMDVDSQFEIAGSLITKPNLSYSHTINGDEAGVYTYTFYTLNKSNTNEIFNLTNNIGLFIITE